MARLPDEEIRRRYEQHLGLCRISDEDALVRWPDVSPDERDSRKLKAEKAAARYATVVDDETGQRWMGGPQPNSNRRNKVKSVVEQVVELADGDRQREVIDALFAPLTDDSNAVRGKGAERIINIKLAHDEEQRKDREELRKLGKDELLDRLVDGLLESPDMVKGLLLRLNQSKRSDSDSDYDAVGTVVEDEAAA